MMPSERQEPLPFAKPSITERERRAVLDVLQSGWLTTGPRVKEFEAAFAAKVGAQHAVALNSATAALHLALDALDVRRGDEVILPTWTFAATAEVVLYAGAKPVLIDVEPDSLNASVDAFEAAVTPKTKAAIAVHFAGVPGAIEQLVGRLGSRGIGVVEDSAHAFPSRLASGRYAGSLGDAGAYSFYATKTITTGEGGMLVTDDGDLAARVRMMSLHGISHDAWKRYTAEGSWWYDIQEPGYKYNMTDMAAALGLVQLERADELHAERRRLADAYAAAFRASRVADLVELPFDPADGSHAWHLFVIRLALGEIAINRAEVIAALREAGIGASVHFIPLHQHSLYRRLLGDMTSALPVAEREAPRVVSLPLWPGMGTSSVERVVAELEAILHKHRLAGRAAG
jgi:dTDP-4-amino-4,6-dideoxygalactose transaminase